MKPEAQRIAIAELCGWNAKPEDPSSSSGWGVSGEKPKWHYLHQLPDYLNDLNATNQMEEHLHGQEWANYFDAIRTWGGASGVRATAAQRCEQFLRAKGKWVEDKQ